MIIIINGYNSKNQSTVIFAGTITEYNDLWTGKTCEFHYAEIEAWRSGVKLDDWRVSKGRGFGHI